MKSIIGTKIGMTQIFSDKGEAIPVTVVSAGPCIVIQKKTTKTDGYNAIQVGYNPIDEKKINKAQVGHFRKMGTGFFSQLMDFRVDNPDDYQVGQEIKADVFAPGDFVDVTGISKGHGFQGVIKRHGFGGGPTSHGQSDKQRHPGAIGPQRPQKTRKGLRMAGRMGGVAKTIQKVEVVKIIPEKNILLIRGGVPGAKNTQIIVSKTVKKYNPKVIIETKKDAKKEVKKKK
ncbi:MAG: 50S ribosomal protein L3 [Elusimicrobia bacterium RIFOXYC2_FULL_34_12]|nr:MAG: 50S ribosomal protein L3 [Elusimicrobia bacterium RIFOXYC2_FULL_34_12]OGS38589.1 MAG: 50S ribosomal protein L3 [Elusimicrobia bacterium RIFOXYD2_FULL_34_30]HAM38858.1 50S ribosomal protein L3 [Elusimicrobiota bacterium]